MLSVVLWLQNSLKTKIIYRISKIIVRHIVSKENKKYSTLCRKEKSVEETGKEFEGGSIYPLVVNIENAKITEERAYELYELLCQ